jgi:REP element-mobilizing transposase RayT
MARLARFVIPGIPHHVTQRGNGRQQAFFCDDDYALYRDLLRAHAAASGVAVWSWVLMPNHVHLILVPETEDSLRACLSKVHRVYAGHIHVREKRTGHFRVWNDYAALKFYYLTYKDNAWDATVMGNVLTLGGVLNATNKSRGGLVRGVGPAAVAAGIGCGLSRASEYCNNLAINVEDRMNELVAEADESC